MNDFYDYTTFNVLKRLKTGVQLSEKATHLTIGEKSTTGIVTLSEYEKKCHSYAYYRMLSLSVPFE